MCDRQCLCSRFNRVRSGTRITYGESLAIQQTLQAATCTIATSFEQSGWKSAHSDTLDGESKKESSSAWKGRISGFFRAGVKLLATPDKEEDDWRKLAAEFIALRQLAFIRYIMLQMRNLVSQISTCFILMVLGLNCYPFHPDNALRWSISILCAVLGIPILAVLIEMDRDPTLSRINSTSPDSLDRNAWLRFAQVGALPVLAVLSSHFPAVGHTLFAWIQPALASLH